MKIQVGKEYEFEGRLVWVIDDFDGKTFEVSYSPPFTVKKEDLTVPLTTDYRYGGVGESRERDNPVPRGWKKGH